MQRKQYLRTPLYQNSDPGKQNTSSIGLVIRGPPELAGKPIDNNDLNSTISGFPPVLSSIMEFHTQSSNCGLATSPTPSMYLTLTMGTEFQWFEGARSHQLTKIVTKCLEILDVDC